MGGGGITHTGCEMSILTLSIGSLLCAVMDIFACC